MVTFNLTVFVLVFGLLFGRYYYSYLEEEKFSKALTEFEEKMQKHFVELSHNKKKINDAKKKDIYQVTQEKFSPDKRQKCLFNLEQMIQENFLNGLPREESNWNSLNSEYDAADLSVFRDLSEMVNWFFPVSLPKTGSSFLTYIQKYTSFFETNESKQHNNMNDKVNEEIMTKMKHVLNSNVGNGYSSIFIQFLTEMFHNAERNPLIGDFACKLQDSVFYKNLFDLVDDDSAQTAPHSLHMKTELRKRWSPIIKSGFVFAIFLDVMTQKMVESPIIAKAVVQSIKNKYSDSFFPIASIVRYFDQNFWEKRILIENANLYAIEVESMLEKTSIRNSTRDSWIKNGTDVRLVLLATSNAYKHLQDNIKWAVGRDIRSGIDQKYNRLGYALAYFRQLDIQYHVNQTNLLDDNYQHLFTAWDWGFLSTKDMHSFLWLKLMCWVTGCGQGLLLRLRSSKDMLSLMMVVITFTLQVIFMLQ